jgi:MFS family permease
VAGPLGLVIGFFMILVDTTIVSVANPAIKAALDPSTNNLDNVVWVTSAYLLAYAVPLLITGRLGDRFGPKRIYLIGLAIFTLASLGCGLSGRSRCSSSSARRRASGHPHDAADDGRHHPHLPADAARRGDGPVGCDVGVAMLVGPLAGGLLVDAFGWEWIFFVNLPVGVIGFVLAWMLVPDLETHPHRFDMVGVFLSAIALFLIVFGLQEGEHYDWAAWVWAMIAGGIVVMALFIWQQAKTKSEPLVPLGLFRDRNFSVANFGIAAVGFTVTALSLPTMFFYQLARGLTPTDRRCCSSRWRCSRVCSPRRGPHPRPGRPRVLLVPGLLFTAIALFWYAALMNPTPRSGCSCCPPR